MCLGQTSAGGTAGLNGLEFFAPNDSAANLVYDISQNRTHGNLDNTCIDNISRQGKYLCARALFRAESPVPL